MLPKNSMFSSFKSFVRSAAARVVRIARNRYFWLGIGVMVVIGALTYVIVDNWIMPNVTRHGVVVVVPDVMSLDYEAAEAEMLAASLDPERVVVRRPQVERDVVIDQRPPGGASVKPGRRVYLTINSGDTTSVAVPKVIGLSLREAQSRMVLLGLVVANVRPDSIPSSHANTVTRQQPGPGSRIPAGTAVTLWYSTGLGDSFIGVPDVTGLPADEAQQQLLRMRLRSVVLGDRGEDDPVVLGQSPEPGTQVREGFEVRLRISESFAPDRP